MIFSNIDSVNFPLLFVKNKIKKLNIFRENTKLELVRANPTHHSLVKYENHGTAQKSATTKSIIANHTQQGGGGGDKN